MKKRSMSVYEFNQYNHIVPLETIKFTFSTSDPGILYSEFAITNLKKERFNAESISSDSLSFLFFLQNDTLFFGEHNFISYLQFLSVDLKILASFVEGLIYHPCFLDKINESIPKLVLPGQIQYKEPLLALKEKIEQKTLLFQPTDQLKKDIQTVRLRTLMKSDF